MFLLIGPREFGEVFWQWGPRVFICCGDRLVQSPKYLDFIKWLGGGLPHPLFCFILTLDTQKIRLPSKTSPIFIEETSNTLKLPNRKHKCVQTNIEVSSIVAPQKLSAYQIHP